MSKGPPNGANHPTVLMRIRAEEALLCAHFGDEQGLLRARHGSFRRFIRAVTPTTRAPILNEPSCCSRTERTTKCSKASDDKRVARLSVVGPNAKSRDVCYLVPIGGKADVAHNLPAVLLRQKFRCDNQCHHARENQQC
jgi:hypothetical protein